METPLDFKAFKNLGVSFFESLVLELEFLGFDPLELRCDHLCYRVKTESEYLHFKHFLSSHSELLTEALVNGRFISTFRLNDPFFTTRGSISLLELPAPKAGTIYETGFEHAEFVVSESFESIKSRFPSLTFKTAGQKNLNPELQLEISSGTAKFHHIPLDRVIEIEEAKITDIIFDFDGTLIQSREQIYEINRRVFSKVCKRDITLDEAKIKFYPEFSKLFTVFEVSCPVARKEALDLWGKVAQDFHYPLFETVIPLLEALIEKGFRLHLWTARDADSATKIIKIHQLENYFTSMSFASELDSKPAATSFKWNWQSAKPNSVLMVGDSSTDILGGKNINAITAAALWDPNACIDSLTKNGAELFFDEVVDLHTWLA